MSYPPSETPIAATMRRHGLIQTEVAADADISQAYLSQIASGLRVPSLPVALRLQAVLRARTGEEVTIEQLFGTPDLPGTGTEG